jgi:repressor LexA
MVAVMNMGSEQAIYAIRERIKEKTTQKRLGQAARRSQAWVNQELLSDPEKVLRRLWVNEPETINKILTELDWTPEEFTRHTGIQLPELSSVGSRPLPPDAVPYKPSLRVPILGEVAAGMHPVYFRDHADEYMLVDEQHLPKGTRLDRLYALRVIGDSMTSEDIVSMPPGSVVIVEAEKAPVHRDLAIAFVRCPKVNFEGTVVKVFYEYEDSQILSSWNPLGPTFRLEECDEVSYQGVVRLVMVSPAAMIRRR